MSEVETFLVRQLREVYQRVLPLAVRNARLAAMIALAFLVVCGVLGMRLGTEFLPKLEEGNLWIRALLPPTITLEAGMDTRQRASATSSRVIRRCGRSFPSRAAARTAPIRTALSSPNSSCR